MPVCEYQTCTQTATVELLFTSGMHGKYCTPHAFTFDPEIIEDIASPLPAVQQSRNKPETSTQSLVAYLRHHITAHGGDWHVNSTAFYAQLFLDGFTSAQFEDVKNLKLFSFYRAGGAFQIYEKKP